LGPVVVVGAGDVVLLGIAEDEDVVLPAVGLPPGVVAFTCITPFIVVG
jgi:hypothetical protein